MPGDSNLHDGTDFVKKEIITALGDEYANVMVVDREGMSGEQLKRYEDESRSILGILRHSTNVEKQLDAVVFHEVYDMHAYLMKEFFALPFTKLNFYTAYKCIYQQQAHVTLIGNTLHITYLKVPGKWRDGMRKAFERINERDITTPVEDTSRDMIDKCAKRMS
jgi:hypothetical protein